MFEIIGKLILLKKLIHQAKIKHLGIEKKVNICVMVLLFSAFKKKKKQRDCVRVFIDLATWNIKKKYEDDQMKTMSLYDGRHV